MADPLQVHYRLTRQATQYAVFEPDQVLTHGQLNSLSEFLDRQDRLSRVDLIGVGIASGLRVSRVEAGVRISRGMGITSDQFNALAGDLLAALTELGVPYALDGSQPIDPLLIALVGMQTEIVTDPDGTITTFNKIGGYGAVNAVIDEFLANVAADTRINGFFATTDLANLKQLLVEQVCNATGGYCVYSGRSMCEAHDGMGVTSDDFNALVEDLLTALDTLGVPYALDGSEAIDPLLIALVGMEGQVLGTDCP